MPVSTAFRPGLGPARPRLTFIFPFAAWEPVQINTGYGNEGFFINDAGLQWSNQIFGGWLGTFSPFVQHSGFSAC